MAPPRFDSAALFQALEDVRRERGLSWQDLARTSGVAAATLKRTAVGRPLEADGVLAMVRLVGKHPESFSAGVPVPAGPLHPGRLNTQALHAALDAERAKRGLSWIETAREIGPWSAGSLQRLAKGGRVTADLMLACTRWLRRPVDDFVDAEFVHPGERRRER